MSALSCRSLAIFSVGDGNERAIGNEELRLSRMKYSCEYLYKDLFDICKNFEYVVDSNLYKIMVISMVNLTDALCLQRRNNLTELLLYPAEEIDSAELDAFAVLRAMHIWVPEMLKPVIADISQCISDIAKNISDSRHTRTFQMLSVSLYDTYNISALLDVFFSKVMHIPEGDIKTVMCTSLIRYVLVNSDKLLLYFLEKVNGVHMDGFVLTDVYELYTITAGSHLNDRLVLSTLLSSTVRVASYKYLTIDIRKRDKFITEKNVSASEWRKTLHIIVNAKRVYESISDCKKIDSDTFNAEFDRRRVTNPTVIGDALVYPGNIIAIQYNSLSVLVSKHRNILVLSLHDTRTGECLTTDVPYWEKIAVLNSKSWREIMEDSDKRALECVPNADANVLQFITNLCCHTAKTEKEYEVLRHTFRAGYCYYFAHLLKQAFQRGEVCLAAPLGHFVWVDTNGVAYDVEGVNCGEQLYNIPEHYLGDYVHEFTYIPNVTVTESTPDDVVSIIRRYESDMGFEPADLSVYLNSV